MVAVGMTLANMLQASVLPFNGLDRYTAAPPRSIDDLTAGEMQRELSKSLQFRAKNNDTSLKSLNNIKEQKSSSFQ